MLDDDGGEVVACAAACLRLGALQVAGEVAGVEGISCRGGVDDARDALTGNRDAFVACCVQRAFCAAFDDDVFDACRL